jgi:hypothetical protein
VKFIRRRELEIRIGAAQMREGVGDRCAGLAVGEHGGYFKLRVRRDQAQQLAGDVTGTAQHNGRRGRSRRGTAHSPATLDSRTLRSRSEAMM